MRIGIDIDNVITNTDEYLIEKAKLYNSLNNISYRIKENPTSLSDMFSWDKDILMDFENKYLRLMNKEVSCKKDVLSTLNKLKKDGHQIILITRRGKWHYLDCREITIKWMKENNIIYDKLITDVDDKSIVCSSEKIDLFIDDDPTNCMMVSSKGIKTYIFDSLFNRHVHLYERINNWDELFEIINSK